MWYLFLQMYGWIFLAFVLGWVCHWFFCCRGKKEASDAASAIATTNTESATEPETLTVVETAQSAIDDSWKPTGFASRPDNADELKRIKGIGAVIEETLNQLGVYQFEQIAQWSPDNVSWVEKFLAFPGRVGRESWISQAETLSVGGTTEFAKRVDDGDVDYS